MEGITFNNKQKNKIKKNNCDYLETLVQIMRVEGVQMFIRESVKSFRVSGYPVNQFGEPLRVLFALSSRILAADIYIGVGISAGILHGPPC